MSPKRKTTEIEAAPAKEPSPPPAKEPSPPPAKEPSPPPVPPAQPSPPGRDASYVVLARRYRPNQLEEVVGQEHVTRTLQNAIQAGRVHHAYLFTGSRGVGKTTVARILAKALNCDGGATAHPCDACTSCQEIKGGVSLDVYEIDGASHTGVDDVRELRESVRYQPARCRHKIYIIDEVHMLSTSAFNALLKTLEEPPPHVVFIFATTEPHKIPATILSRCQRFDFKRVPDPVLIHHLGSLCEREQTSVERGGLALIARASEGSVRDALSLLDQVIAYASGESISTAHVAEVLGVADRRVLYELSRAVLGRDAQGALAVVGRLFEGGQDLAQFAQAFLAHLRDLTVVCTCQEPAALLDATEAEIAELRQQAGGGEPEGVSPKGERAGALCAPGGAHLLPQHFDRFARTAEEIARSSFPRLLLEMALIEMVHAEPLLPLGDLLERLERLEGRLGGASPSSFSAPRFSPPGPGAGRPPSSARSSASSPGRHAAPGSAPPAAPRPAPLPHGTAPAPHGSAPAPVEPLPCGDNGHDLESWQRLLKAVEAVQPVVASAFVSGRLLGWSAGQITLGYPPDSFELQRAQDREKRQLFEAECSRQLGHKISVEVRGLRAEEAASPEVLQMSAAQERERHKVERSERLREEARAHPVTRALVEKCGAQIEAITTAEAEEP